MNLGIDFGSTYSMMSFYDAANRLITPIQTETGSPYIPSVACLDYGDELITGQQAKDFINGEPLAVAYRAFKMLLTEGDPQLLEQMHYTREHNPRYIAKEFLKQMLLLAREGRVNKFERVVICIPQVWNTDIYTMSGKAILQEICMELKEELNILDKVTVVSEPAAASAFYAHEYLKNTKQDFSERMLIVDYGGGTLDISLTKVNSIPGKAGSTSMEIDVEGETGAGENKERQIGSAGIAYLEGTVRLALEEAGFAAVPNDGAFVRAVNLFESALTGNGANRIRQKVRLECNNDISRLEYDPDVLTTLFYRGTRIPLTYDILYRSYQNIIAPVLEEQLDKIRRDYLNPINLDPRLHPDKLKLALVGGFGKFELVRQQVYDFFDMVPQLDESGSEDAICRGAALLADGVVTLRKCAKLSIGLVVDIGGEKTFDFAITKGMDLDYDKVCYMSIPVVFGGELTGPNAATWEFAIGRGSNLDFAHRLIPLAPTQEKLNQIQPGRYYTFGFSMDDSGIYSIHVIPTDAYGEIRYEAEGKKIALGNFSDIFGPNVSYEKTEVIKRL